MNDLEMTSRVISLLFEEFNRAKPDRAAPAPVNPAFTIAISREAGALGTTVANEIGRQLGWPVYDRELLDKVAEQMRRPSFHLQGIDERPASWLEDCLRALTTDHGVSTSVYIKYLAAAVRGLDLGGHCVVVGRGASCILPPATTVRVRLVAPLPERVKVIARRHGLIEKDAARWIAKTDRDRAEFVRTHFRADPAAADHYDLVLNSSRLTPAECARAVIEVLRMFETRTGGPNPAEREAGAGAEEPHPEALACKG
jgi:cytidylate kinase